MDSLSEQVMKAILQKYTHTGAAAIPITTIQLIQYTQCHLRSIAF